MRRLFAVVLTFLLMAPTVRASAPNDACTQPIVIDALPFTTTLNNDVPVKEPDEPDPCHPPSPYGYSYYGARGAIWFRYNPTKDATLCVKSCRAQYSHAQVESMRCESPDTCGNCRDDACFAELSCTNSFLIDVHAGVSEMIALRGQLFPYYYYSSGFPPTFSVYDVAADTDGDGVSDCVDRCPELDDNLDTDGDGITDCLDLCVTQSNFEDSDGDTVPDCFDECPGADDRLDNDGDFVPDCKDVCPGRPDFLDQDQDHVPDCLDNCPFDPNENQVDTDQNGIGDACEPSAVGAYTLTATLRSPSPAAGDAFGSAVAIGDTSVLVGAPSADAGKIDSGAAYLFSVGGAFEVTLGKTAPAAGDAFGSAVGLLNDDGVGSFPLPVVTVTPLVGAPLDDAGLPDLGAAYIFSRATPDGPYRDSYYPISGSLTPSAELGFAIDATSDFLTTTLVAGAPGDDRDGTDAGATFLLAYTLFPPSFVPSILRSPLLAPGAQFGAAVAIDRTTVYQAIPNFRTFRLIAVGAPTDSIDVESGGAVHVFDLDTRQLVQSFRSPAPAVGDLFGTAVALDNGRLYVGAPGDDGGGTDAGAVFVFDVLANTLVTTLRKPAPAAGDQFGTALAAVSGGRILVGVPGDDTGAHDAGSAYLFRRLTDPSFGLVRAFLNPVPDAGDRFGQSVAIQRDAASIDRRIVIGAPGEDRGGTDAGAAYVFTACTDCPTGCGNGLVEAPEECDDANQRDGDGCDNGCVRTRCGNGRLSSGEQCDDGDTEAGDGCSPTCTVEPFYTCTGQPSVCTLGCDQTPGAARNCCTCPQPGVPCNDDGNPCTTNDHCENNVLVGDPVSCDDQNACTDDYCDPAKGCVHVTHVCPDDGSRCTQENCNPVLGCISTAIPNCCQADEDCRDADPCNGAEECRLCVGCDFHALPCCTKGATCVARRAANDGTTCDDQDACTVGDRCQQGRCTSGAAKACDDGDGCTVDVCQEPSGDCVKAATARGCKCSEDGECDDQNVCNGVEHCVAGTCAAGITLVCDDGDPCTNDRCDAIRGCTTDRSADPSCLLNGGVASCAGDLPGAVVKQLRRVGPTLIEAAQTTSAKKRQRLYRKCLGWLKHGNRAVARLVRKGNGSCSPLGDAIGTVQVGIQALVAG